MDETKLMVRMRSSVAWRHIDDLSSLQLVLSRVDKFQAIAAGAELVGEVADAASVGVGEAAVGGVMPITQATGKPSERLSKT